MDAILEYPQGTLVEQINDKVGGLEVAVAVLTTQHANVLEAVNRIELVVRQQSVTSEEYRAKLLSEITAVAASVRTVEGQVENVTRELDRIKERGTVNWIRKNAPVVTIALAILTVLWAVGRWLLAHLHF